MKAEYPVEYILNPGDPGWGEVTRLDLGPNGQWDFAPNPDYGGRRIVLCQNKKQAEAILDRNPWGEVVWVEPTDVVSLQQKANIKQIINEVLVEHGLLGGGGVETTVVTRKNPGPKPKK